MTVSKPIRVLVVEDEYFLADDLKRALDKEGVVVLGPVATEADALTLLADTSVDCAILDINLRGKMVYPFARELRSREVPFLFVSGYDAVETDAGFADITLIRKPFTVVDVIAGIRRLTASKHRIGAERPPRRERKGGPSRSSPLV